MWNGIIYLRTRRRMPVRLGVAVYSRDIQQDIPLNWCALCGREIYHPDAHLCRSCEGGTEDEQTERMQPL